MLNDVGQNHQCHPSETENLLPSSVHLSNDHILKALQPSLCMQLLFSAALFLCLHAFFSSSQTCQCLLPIRSETMAEIQTVSQSREAAEIQHVGSVVLCAFFRQITMEPDSHAYSLKYIIVHRQ